MRSLDYACRLLRLWPLASCHKTFYKLFTTTIEKKDKAMPQYNVPEFKSQWTKQMTKELTTWPEEAIVEKAERICQSWGDRYKWDRVKFLFERVLHDPQKLTEAIAIAEAWSKSH